LDFAETDLQTIFEVALKAKKGIRALRSLLASYMTVKSMPDWYRFVSGQYWYRVYTTNIDNLVESIYKSPIIPVKLDVLVAEKDDYKEHDQYLKSIQYIKLNGSFENDPRTYTFSTRQFARRSTDFDIWYDHFVRDYMTNVTVFIGSNLNEPIFWRHIELRDRRRRGVAESRPRSFLICPNVPRAKQDTLADWNIVPVEAKTEDFFKWLNTEIGVPESRRTVIENSRPDLTHIFRPEHEGLSEGKITKLEHLYKNFKLIEAVSPSPSHTTKSYLLGKAPEWQDFAHNLDAWRDINDKFIEKIESYATDVEDMNVVALLGSAGSGKSTILKRSALNLAAKGHLYYFTNSEELLNWEDFNVAVEEINKKLLIFMDDTEFALRWLARIVENGKDLAIKPTFIISSRTNRFERYAGNLLKATDVKEIETPDLSDGDIHRIIDKLAEEDLLGTLRGKTPEQQFREFKIRARKQILVAMREATEGRDFDEIMKSEYAEIEPLEARHLYLCIALSSAEKFSIDIKQVVACSDEDASAAINYIGRNLKGLVSKPYSDKELYEARHPIIADYIVEGIADRNHLKESYIRLLSVLAHDKGMSSTYGSKMNRLFRRLINHYVIYRRFHSEVELAREIYDSVTKFLNNDYHFWLQFGSMELEYGELDHAANYLAQAESLSPYDNFISRVQ